MRMSSNPALVSTRARSCSPYSRSSSRSRSASRYRSHSRSRRSYSRSRSSSWSHYSRSRNRTWSKTISRSRRRTKSTSRTESGSSTRSRSSCRQRTISRSSSTHRLPTGPRSTSWSQNRHGTNGKRSYTRSSSVTRTRSKSPQGISGQQRLSVQDDLKGCSRSVSTGDKWKSLLDGNQKSAVPNEECRSQTQNTAWDMASSNASRSLSNSAERNPCSGSPLPGPELTGVPGENLGKTDPDISFTKDNLRPKSDNGSRSKSCRSQSRSPGRKHSRSWRRKKEKMRTWTNTDPRDREDNSEDENRRGSTAKTEHGGQDELGPTLDSKNRTKDLETMDEAGASDLETRGHVSSSSPARKFKKRKVATGNYRSRGHRSESYESTSCSVERCSRGGAKDYELRKRKTKRCRRRHSTSSSESSARRKPPKKKRAKKMVTKKRRKLPSKSKQTRTKTVSKKLKKESSVPPSSESSSLDTDTDSYEKSRRKRRYESKRKMALRTSEGKSKGNERIKYRKGSRHKKRRKL